METNDSYPLPGPAGNEAGPPAEIVLNGEEANSAAETAPAAEDPGFVISAPPDREREGSPDDTEQARPGGSSEDGIDGSSAEQTDRVDGPPPGPPTEQTGQPEYMPERGAALRRLVDFAEGSSGQIHEALASKILGSRGGFGMLSDAMQAGDLTVDEAVDVVGAIPTSEGSIVDGITRDQTTVAKVVYGGDLAATGLAFQPQTQITGRIDLRLEDPTAFAHALSETPVPAPEANDNLSIHTEQILSDALTRTSSLTVIQNHQEALDICGGEPPPQAHVLYYGMSEDAELPAEMLQVTDGLTEHAASIAADLQRVGCYPNTVDSVRQLAVAREEGLMTHWAVAHSMGLIGNNQPILGIERFSTPEEWAAADRFLDHLTAHAPGSRLLEEVRSQVVSDVVYTLTGRWRANTPAYEAALQDETFARSEAVRAEFARRSRPLLEAALLKFGRG